MPTLNIDAEQRGAAYVIRVRGELDLAGCPALERALEEAENGQGGLILVDLEELTFIDGSGLESLLLASRRSATNGHRIRVTQGKGEVARLFRLTDADRILPLVAAEGN